MISSDSLVIWKGSLNKFWFRSSCTSSYIEEVPQIGQSFDLDSRAHHPQLWLNLDSWTLWLTLCLKCWLGKVRPISKYLIISTLAIKTSISIYQIFYGYLQLFRVVSVLLLHFGSTLFIFRSAGLQEYLLSNMDAHYKKHVCLGIAHVDFPFPPFRMGTFWRSFLHKRSWQMFWLAANQEIA